MKQKIPNLLKLQQAAWGIAAGLTSLGIVGIASPATALTLNLDGGSDFTFSADGTTTSGVGTPDETLNTSGGNNGFNGFFTSDYGRLGAADFQAATFPANNRGSSSAVSLVDIVFPEEELADARSVEVRFSYAFAGTAGNPAGDTVEVFLFDTLTGESTSSFDITTLAPAGVPSVTFELTGEDLASLEAGTTYNLLFQLSEGGEPFADPTFTNTAFGFDDVVVETVPIPFEAELSSAAGLLMLGGFWGFSRLKKRAREIN